VVNGTVVAIEAATSSPPPANRRREFTFNFLKGSAMKKELVSILFSMSLGMLSVAAIAEDSDTTPTSDPAPSATATEPAADTPTEVAMPTPTDTAAADTDKK
jgi:hypothetical protein